MTSSGRIPLLLILALLLAAPACRDEKKVSVAAGLRPDTMPTMSTVNVATLISDSGVTQYKIVSPLWKVYDGVEDPYWTFPKGLYLQKYDPMLRVVATIAADSARYFKNRRLWRLDGHVEIRKKPKDLFYTSQVFWDQNRRRIYSDSFIHIENATHVLEGYGFVSDERFETYTIRRPQGIFPVESDAMGRPAGPAAPPGTSVNPAPVAAR